jgi:hypothetical protein
LLCLFHRRQSPQNNGNLCFWQINALIQDLICDNRGVPVVAKSVQDILPLLSTAVMQKARNQESRGHFTGHNVGFCKNKNALALVMFRFNRNDTFAGVS